jgi:uncharacterized protein YegL
MRRLPIFFVIDVSESMIGEPILDVAAGMRTMIQTLRQNPYALETAYISVIVFAGKAKTLVPLTDVVSFYQPQMPIGGGTSLGAGLQHLISEIDTKLIKNDGTTKGDWKPVIFLFTDGVSTDNTDQAVYEWEAKYRDRVNLVAISIGNHADLNLLRRLTDQVLLFNDTKPEAYKDFFKWITASIATQSQKIETSADDNFQLEKLNDAIARKFDLSKPMPLKVDDNCVVLQACCQQNGAPYLIKFRRNTTIYDWDAFVNEGHTQTKMRKYTLSGAFAIASPEEYQELTLESGSTNLINTSELEGSPSCPCCGNAFALSWCSCGGILCTQGVGANFCPHCRRELIFELAEGDDDIRRGLG